jgi:multicomponent Na+:H+ antiporter subunit G
MTAVGEPRALLTVALIAVGCFFLAVGTVGLLRFPNVYNRMHATSKPTTLGTAAVFFAGFVYFGPGGAGLTSLLGIAFLFLTVPTGAHMIARSAEQMGVPFRGSVTWPALPGSDEDESPEEGGRTDDGEADDGSGSEGGSGGESGGSGNDDDRNDGSGGGSRGGGDGSGPGVGEDDREKPGGA